MALTIDGSDPTGDLGDLLAAKLAVAGGKILQIVRATDATNRSTTSTSFVDANISASITPALSTSDLYFFWTVRCAPANGEYISVQITDNSNVALTGADVASFGPGVSGSGAFTQLTLIGTIAASTTSAQTYKGRLGSSFGASVQIQNATSTGVFLIIEVSA